MKPEKTPSKRLFYSPFEDIKKRVKAAKEHVETPRVPSAAGCQGMENDEELFSRAMADVVPMDAEGVQGIEPVRGATKKNVCPVPENIEVMAELNELISGRSPLDVKYSEEYVSWCSPNVTPACFRELKSGRLPVQAYVDLHGLSVEQAKTLVDEFLGKSFGEKLRCVLVVHGRGRNSKDKEPILKKRVVRWLRSGPNMRRVQAFASALGYDGGLGAMYVLLGKAKKGDGQR